MQQQGLQCLWYGPRQMLGYGLLFGLGGGVGFIVVQQGVNQTVRTKTGLVNGYVIEMQQQAVRLVEVLHGERKA